MNYFELFNIPVQFKVDKTLLRKRYFELSRAYHPVDRLPHSAGAQQQEKEASALLNEAYRTLQSEEATIRYILQEKGLSADEASSTLPPGFLMQMEDLEKQLAEASLQDDTDKKTRILQQLITLEKEIYEPVRPVLEQYTEGITPQSQLLAIRDYYQEKKYIHRLMHQIAQKL